MSSGGGNRSFRSARNTTKWSVGLICRWRSSTKDGCRRGTPAPSMGRLPIHDIMTDEDEEIAASMDRGRHALRRRQSIPPETKLRARMAIAQGPRRGIEMGTIRLPCPPKERSSTSTLWSIPVLPKTNGFSDAQMIPGNHAVVHHGIVFTRPPDGSDFRDIGLLTAYVPGQMRGSSCPTDTHSGFPLDRDCFSNALHAQRQTATGHHASWTGVRRSAGRHSRSFCAGRYRTGLRDSAASRQTTPSMVTLAVFPKMGFCLSITPHMHLRGKSFEFHLESARGNETLLKVPAYDFNWQHNYELTSPLPLAPVDKLCSRRLSTIPQAIPRIQTPMSMSPGAIKRGRRWRSLSLGSPSHCTQSLYRSQQQTADRREQTPAG